MKKISRRSFLTVVGAAAATAALTACGGSSSSTAASTSSAASTAAPAATASNASVVLKFDLTVSLEHPWGLAATEFKNRIEEKSGGSMTVEIYPSSTSGSEADSLAGMLVGTTSMTMSGGSFNGYAPSATLLEAPWAYNSEEDVQAMCESDIGKGIMQDFEDPVVLGHEGSGEVIAVGEGVTDLKPGASVVFEPITYCGKCYACRCGHHNVCRELKVLGCIVDGIFQEYVVMPRSQVYEYDASKMTYQQAALWETFTLGLQANWRGDVRPGDVVLVHGGGPIGLIVANIAKSRGATVIVSEPNESRLAMAKDFGADYSINPMKEDLDAFINKLTDGEGVNVIFEAAGVPALLAHATSQLSPAGRLVAMTFGKEPIPVNFKEINAKELTILGTRHQYQKFPEVVKILPDHLKEVDEITTHVFKAEDFQKAFDTLADRNSGAGKVVLTFA